MQEKEEEECDEEVYQNNYEMCPSKTPCPSIYICSKMCFSYPFMAPTN